MRYHTRLKAVTCFFATLLLLQSPAALAQDNHQLEQAIDAIEKSLPVGWIIADQKSEEIPWGHHWCDEYTGTKGLKLDIKGIRAVHTEFRGREDGVWRSIPVGVESLEVWVMPEGYSDSFWSWACFHRPIQPTKVVQRGSVKIYARPASILNSKEEFDKLLAGANSVRSPDSPWNAPDTLTWKTWQKDLVRAATAIVQK